MQMNRSTSPRPATVEARSTRDAQRGTPVVSRGTTQLKVGLRVRDLEASCALYLKLGFRQIPRPDERWLRYLTFGHTWLILSDRYNHGYHNAQRRDAAIGGPLGAGFVLAIPTPDLDAIYDLWRSEGLPVTLGRKTRTGHASSMASTRTVTSSCSSNTTPSTSRPSRSAHRHA